MIACSTGEACGLTDTRSSARRGGEPQRRHDRRPSRRSRPGGRRPSRRRGRRAAGWRRRRCASTATGPGAGSDPAPRGRPGSSSRPPTRWEAQRLVEVGDQVLGVLQPDRQPQQDSAGLAAASTGRWVSEAGCWMSESTPPSDTAWVTRCRPAATARARRAAAPHVEGEQAAGSALSACRADRADPRPDGSGGGPWPPRGGTPGRPATCVAVRCWASHPQRQRGQPAVQQVRRQRVQQGAGDRPHRAAAGPPSRRSHATDAADHVAVPAEELRGAVQGQRGARDGRAAAAPAWRRCCRPAPGRRRPAPRRRRCRPGPGSGWPASRRMTSPVSGRIAAATPLGATQVTSVPSSPVASRWSVPPYSGRTATTCRAPHRDARRGAPRSAPPCRWRRPPLSAVPSSSARAVLEPGDRGVPQPGVDRPPGRGHAAGRHRLVGVPSQVDVGERVGAGEVEGAACTPSSEKSARPAWTAVVRGPRGRIEFSMPHIVGEYCPKPCHGRRLFDLEIVLPLPWKHTIERGAP